MKADDKVQFEDNEKEKYTEFELLKATVEVLKEEIELIGKILGQHNLALKEKQEASIDLTDDIYKRVEE